ncbi:hypothetical protein ACLOJK_018990, partial [Asimina triloba]
APSEHRVSVLHLPHGAALDPPPASGKPADPCRPSSSSCQAIAPNGNQQPANNHGQQRPHLRSGNGDTKQINDVHSDRKPSIASTSRTQPQQWAIPDPDREHRPPPFGRSTSPSMTATMKSISMDETSMKWAAPLESADINVSIIAINRKPSVTSVSKQGRRYFNGPVSTHDAQIIQSQTASKAKSPDHPANPKTHLGTEHSSMASMATSKIYPAFHRPHPS